MTTGPTDARTDDTARSVRTPSSALPVAVGALALGALSLPDPNRLPSGRRHLLRLGRAAYVGWYSGAAARRAEVPDVPAPLFGAVAGAAVALVTAPVDEATDAWLTGLLRRAGVTRPRLAAALAGAGLGAWVAVDSQRVTGSQDPTTADDLFRTGDLPDDARRTMELLLTAAPSESADTLLRQLEVARATVPVGGMSLDVYLEVPDDSPRVVPHTQVWPVRAHVEAGVMPLEIELATTGGHLTSLTISQRSEDLTDDDPRWDLDVHDVLQGWPPASELRLVTETPDGYRPLG